MCVKEEGTDFLNIHVCPKIKLFISHENSHVASYLLKVLSYTL